MKKFLPFVAIAGCAVVLGSSEMGFNPFPPVFAQSTAMPAQAGYVTTTCPNRPSPCFEQYGPVLPIAGSFSASVTVEFPTIGDAVPATGIYTAGNKGGLLTGVTLDGSSNLNVNCVVGCAGGTFTNGTDNVTASSDNGKTAAWVYLWDGTAYDMWRGTAADGALVNLGANNDVTVTSGTITVTQGTAANLNALVTGNVGATQSGTWNIATVSAVTAISNALPAGNNNIGDVDIASGTVSVTGSIVANGGGAAGSANAGVMSVQGIASMTPVQVSQATTASLNATVAGTGTFAVQAAQSGTWNVGTVTALTGGNVTASQGGTWTVQPGNTQNTTPWLTAPSASSGAVGSTRCAITAYANSENETNCKNGAGLLYGFAAFNTTTSALYITFYNAHSGAVCGTSEVSTYVIPGAAAGAGLSIQLPVPEAFSTGISYCITTGIDGTGSVPTSSGSANAWYQ